MDVEIGFIPQTETDEQHLRQELLCKLRLSLAVVVIAALVINKLMF